MLTGVFPPALTHCTKLQHLDISNNFLDLDVVVVVSTSAAKGEGESNDDAGHGDGSSGSSGGGRSSSDLPPVDSTLVSTTPPKPGFTLTTTLLAIANGCPNITLLNVSGNNLKPTTPQQAAQEAVEYAVASAAERVKVAQGSGNGGDGEKSGEGKGAKNKSGWGGGLRAKDEADLRDAGRKSPWVAPDIVVKQSTLFCQVLQGS